VWFKVSFIVVLVLSVWVVLFRVWVGMRVIVEVLVFWGDYLSVCIVRW